MGIVYRILLGVFGLSIFGLWLGFDNLRISAFSNKLTPFSISEVEATGINGERYIKINDAVWDGSVVYGTESKNAGDQSAYINYLIIPIMSKDEAVKTLTESDADKYFGEGGGEKLKQFKMENGDKAQVKVVVRYYPQHALTVSQLDNWQPDEMTDSDDDFSVEGLTRIGFDSLDMETKNLLSSLNHEISPDVILIDDGKKPESLAFGLIISVLSLVGFIGVPLFGYKLYNRNDINSSNQMLESEELTSLNLNK